MQVNRCMQYTHCSTSSQMTIQTGVYPARLSTQRRVLPACTATRSGGLVHRSSLGFSRNGTCQPGTTAWHGSLAPQIAEEGPHANNFQPGISSQRVQFRGARGVHVVPHASDPDSASSSLDSDEQRPNIGSITTRAIIITQTAFYAAKLYLTQLYSWASRAPILGGVVRWLTKYRDVVLRCTVTIGMLALIRSGLFIPLPGVDMQHIPPMGPTSEGERLVRALYGQSSALPACLFDLGISPFINASICITIVLLLPQQMTVLFPPWIRKLQEARKEGSSGAATIKRATNYTAGAFALYLAVLRAIELEPHALFTGDFLFSTTLSLMAGSCIMHFASDFITYAGVGNGSTLVICCGIITEYAETLHHVLTGLTAGAVASSSLVGVLLVYLMLVLFALYLNTSKLKLPIIQYAVQAEEPGTDVNTRQDMFQAIRPIAEKKLAQRSQRDDYFPIPINAAGMMPIIFAGAWCFGLQPKLVALIGWEGLIQGYARMQNGVGGILYYGLLVFASSLMPLGGIAPKEVAEYFSTLNVGIRGIVPGETTENYLKGLLQKTRFWGGLALASLAVMAIFFDMACQELIGSKLGTTNLLIIVGAVLEISRQVEALLEGPRLQEKLRKEQAIIQSLRVL